MIDHAVMQRNYAAFSSACIIDDWADTLAIATCQGTIPTRAARAAGACYSPPPAMTESIRIDLDREAFLTLVQTLCMARWICSTRHAEDPPLALEREIRSLEETLLSHAEKLGCGNIVEFDQASGGQYPTPRFEETSEARTAMERYEDDFFWSELVRVLSKRDLDRKAEGEYERAIEKLPDHQRHPVEERYWEEFYRNGVSNLALLREEPAE